MPFTARRAIGSLMMAACIAALLAWNIHPPEGEDTNLLVRAVVTLTMGGGAFMARRFLVRRRESDTL